MNLNLKSCVAEAKYNDLLLPIGTLWPKGIILKDFIKGTRYPD